MTQHKLSKFIHRKQYSYKIENGKRTDEKQLSHFIYNILDAKENIITETVYTNDKTFYSKTIYEYDSRQNKVAEIYLDDKKTLTITVYIYKNNKLFQSITGYLNENNRQFSILSTTKNYSYNTNDDIVSFDFILPPDYKTQSDYKTQYKYDYNYQEDGSKNQTKYDETRKTETLTYNNNNQIIKKVRFDGTEIWDIREMIYNTYGLEKEHIWYKKNGDLNRHFVYELDENVNKIPDDFEKVEVIQKQVFWLKAKLLKFLDIEHIEKSNDLLIQILTDIDSHNLQQPDNSFVARAIYRNIADLWDKKGNSAKNSEMKRLPNTKSKFIFHEGYKQIEEMRKTVHPEAVIPVIEYTLNNTPDENSMQNSDFEIYFYLYLDLATDYTMLNNIKTVQQAREPKFFNQIDLAYKYSKLAIELYNAYPEKLSTVKLNKQLLFAYFICCRYSYFISERYLKNNRKLQVEYLNEAARCFTYVEKLSDKNEFSFYKGVGEAIQISKNEIGYTLEDFNIGYPKSVREAKKENNELNILKSSQKGFVEVVSNNIKNGSNIDIQDNEGLTPLMLAVANNHIDVVRLLLSNNANVEIKDNDGQTALMLASLNGYYEIANLLIENGANCNIQDKRNLTALTLAVANNQIDVIKLLLNKGAKINNLTIEIAQQSNNQEIINILKNSNPDIQNAIQIPDRKQDILKYMFNSGRFPLENIYYKYISRVLSSNDELTIVRITYEEITLRKGSVWPCVGFYNGLLKLDKTGKSSIDFANLFLSISPPDESFHNQIVETASDVELFYIGFFDFVRYWILQAYQYVEDIDKVFKLLNKNEEGIKKLRYELYNYAIKFLNKSLNKGLTGELKNYAKQILENINYYESVEAYGSGYNPNLQTQTEKSTNVSVNKENTISKAEKIYKEAQAEEDKQNKKRFFKSYVKAMELYKKAMQMGHQEAKKDFFRLKKR